jgi:catechol 2,3-dioxygenase-like lactoylglutathione lyase family enzyme
MPTLGRILETALYVDDLARAATFYETVLGLSAMLETPTLRAYDVGGASVLLLFKRGASLKTQASPGGTIPPHDGSGPQHIGFAVTAEALKDWEDRLGAAGVAIEGRMNWDQGGTSIYFRDPDDNMLELLTPGLWPNYR